jgi:hypothetical protein
MNELLLGASVKAQVASKNVAKRLNDVTSSDRASVVENVIIIGILVVICIFVGAALIGSMTTQSEKLSNCISGINTGTCGDYETK